MDCQRTATQCVGLSELAENAVKGQLESLCCRVVRGLHGCAGVLLEELEVRRDRQGRGAAENVLPHQRRGEGTHPLASPITCSSHRHPLSHPPFRLFTHSLKQIFSLTQLFQHIDNKQSFTHPHNHSLIHYAPKARWLCAVSAKIIC